MSYVRVTVNYVRVTVNYVRLAMTRNAPLHHLLLKGERDATRSRGNERGGARPYQSGSWSGQGAYRPGEGQSGQLGATEDADGQTGRQERQRQRAMTSGRERVTKNERRRSGPVEKPVRKE